jgi:pectate lyase
MNSGGTSSPGGATSLGGSTNTGGTISSGGTTQTGGTTSAGGTTITGGTTGEVINGCPVKLEGWAEFAGTTGGGDAPPQKVTSVAELLTLSKDETPRVIELEGTYDFGSEYLRVGSNKTFIGKGKNTVLKAGKAVVSLRGSHNVILRNFTVIGGGKAAKEDGDALTATQADKLWFDHLTAIDGPDGILDLTQGTTHATVSWCKFYYTEADHPHRLALLFSSGSDPGVGATDIGKMEHTLHHNWFGELVSERMPRLLWGKGHMYNNFYNSPNNEYCIGGGSWASLLVENNYFLEVKDPHRFQDMCPTYIAATGNVYVKTLGKQETGLFAGDFPKCISTAPIPEPWTPPYKYTLGDAEGVPELVKRCAGPQ